MKVLTGRRISAKRAVAVMKLFMDNNKLKRFEGLGPAIAVGILVEAVAGYDVGHFQISRISAFPAAQDGIPDFALMNPGAGGVGAPAQLI